MEDRRLSFGPRYDEGLNWVCEDGSPADDDDVGLQVTCTEDEGLTISVGSKHGWRGWQLTPEQAGELVAFFYECRGSR